ncbi:MAG: TolC family protein, partial [Verrucomicrobiota bacterium]
MIKRSFVGAVVGTVLCAGSLRAQPNLEEQLPEALLPGLNQILETAIYESSAMRLRAYAEEESEGQMKVSRSRKMARVSTVVSYRKEEDLDSNSDGSANNDTERLIYGVSMSQPLYHWGVLKAQKEVGILGYENSQLATENEYGILARNIRLGFLDTLLARKRIDLVKDSKILKEKELETERVRSEEGFVSMSRVSSLEFALSQVEVDIIRKETDYQNRLANLVSLSGSSEEEIESVLVGEIPKFDAFSAEEIDSLKALFVDAIASHDQTEILGNNIEVAKLNLHQASNRLKPNVNLTSGLTQNERDISGRLTEEQFAFAGVTVNWNIFDGFETSGHKSVAISRLQRAEERLLLHEKGMRQNLSVALNNFDMSARMLSVAESNLNKAKARVNRAKDLFGKNKASQLDIDMREFELKQQTLSTEDSRAAYLKSLAQLALL